MEDTAIFRDCLSQLQASREQIKATAPNDPDAEVLLERIFDQISALAEEVSLTPMPTLEGLSCKAKYLLEYVDPTGGDIATELARSLATDVLAVAGQSP